MSLPEAEHAHLPQPFPAGATPTATGPAGPGAPPVGMLRPRARSPGQRVGLARLPLPLPHRHGPQAVQVRSGVAGARPAELGACAGVRPPRGGEGNRGAEQAARGEVGSGLEATRAAPRPGDRGCRGALSAPGWP